MPSWLNELPFGLMVASLFGIVFLRAQGTYWLGRGASAGTARVRKRDWLEGERAKRAIRALHRWGLPVIPVSFLTVGFQTVVNGTAGVIRMPWPRYTLAMIPGCVAWAFLYGTALDVTLTLALRSPWALAGIVATIAAVVGAVVWHRRRQRAAAGEGCPVMTVIDDVAEGSTTTAPGRPTI